MVTIDARPAVTIRVRFKHSFLQATRTAPAKSVTSRVCFTPVGPVTCTTMEEVQHVASSFNAEIIRE